MVKTVMFYTDNVGSGGIPLSSVVDPIILNLDPDPGLGYTKEYVCMYVFFGLYILRVKNN